MPTLELLTLIALWCGNPAVQVGTKDKVIACRAQAVECLDNVNNPKDFIQCITKAVDKNL